MGSIKVQISKFKLLGAIVLLGAFLRLYALQSVPPSPSLDEVSIGYNVYSLLKTGADEYGEKFPILLRAYDDWRPASYVYLVMPFVALLGLQAVAVRLPSVLLSVLTIFATYFLVRKLFSTHTRKTELALLTSLLLAISPWHVYLSRLGHEANAGLAFLIIGTTLVLYKRAFLGIVLLTFSFMAYQSEKIIVPIIFLVLALAFRKEMFAHAKQIGILVLVSLMLLIPFIRATVAPNALIRFTGTNIFTASQERFIKQAQLRLEAIRNKDIVGIVVHNRRVVAAQLALEGYVSHFNSKWLFANLSEDKHKVPGLGLFYIWEAPFLLFGAILFLFLTIDRRVKVLVLTWLLLSPVPAALTTDAPHAMRSYTALPMPQLLTSLGILQVFLLLKYNKVAVTFLLLVIFGSVVFLFRQYFFIFPKTQSRSFQYALAEALPFVQRKEGMYDKVVFSNREHLYQSYMFFLFFNRYDPARYQKLGGTKSGGFAEIHRIGKFEFRPIDWENEKKGKTLFIGNVGEFPRDVNAVRSISNLDGREAIKIVSTDK